jgi:hypothetical protein
MAGDPHKIATSNAFKKAAYLCGIGSYLGLEDLEGMDDTTSMGNNDYRQKPQQAGANHLVNQQVSVPQGQSYAPQAHDNVMASIVNR